MTAVRLDTAQIVTTTADANGKLNGAVIKGSVDIVTGIVRLRFTSNLEDTTGASDIPVIPLLLRYNAVVFTSLPLDATLLGLDPVRLPADGRVPVFREGDVMVVAHTAETTVPSPQAGGVLQLGRDQQAEIKVVDANAVELASAGYSVDLERGRVTWANPLLLQDAEGNPLTLPLVVRDRVEHMTLCTEVQVNGELGISSPLPWDLPAGETLASSALSWGRPAGAAASLVHPADLGYRLAELDRRAEGRRDHRQLQQPRLSTADRQPRCDRCEVGAGVQLLDQFQRGGGEAGGHRQRHYHHRHGADQPGDEHAVLHHPQGRLGQWLGGRQRSALQHRLVPGADVDRADGTQRQGHRRGR
ncbi:hypothetical protein P4110_30685 [Pseudomonas aeruginosa]|nr:hypothetical protein [Pseudomonas aeruginosa]